MCLQQNHGVQTKGPKEICVKSATSGHLGQEEKILYKGFDI